MRKIIAFILLLSTVLFLMQLAIYLSEHIDEFEDVNFSALVWIRVPIELALLALPIMIRIRVGKKSKITQQDNQKFVFVMVLLTLTIFLSELTIYLR